MTIDRLLKQIKGADLDGLNRTDSVIDYFKTVTFSRGLSMDQDSFDGIILGTGHNALNEVVTLKRRCRWIVRSNQAVDCLSDVAL